MGRATFIPYCELLGSKSGGLCDTGALDQDHDSRHVFFDRIITLMGGGDDSSSATSWEEYWRVCGYSLCTWYLGKGHKYLDTRLRETGDTSYDRSSGMDLWCSHAFHSISGGKMMLVESALGGNYYGWAQMFLTMLKH